MEHFTISKYLKSTSLTWRRFIVRLLLLSIALFDSVQCDPIKASIRPQ